MTAALAPLLILSLVLATDIWVYADARDQDDRGTPVVASIGTLRIDTPTAWFCGCLIVWIVFFPWYLAARGDAG